MVAGGREGDPRLRPGAQPGDLRRRDPRADAGADRGASQGTDQGRPPRGGERARGRAQHPPRRQRAPEEAAEGTQGLGGRRAPRAERRAETHRPLHRRDRQGPARQGSRSLHWRDGCRPPCAALPTSSTAVREFTREFRAAHVPRHIAIIMDGNGRWAKQRLLPRVAGHRKGVETVRATVRACIERGVEFLTLFAFSSENWRRPADEVSILMQLFLRALEQEVAKLARERHPLRGDRRHVPLRAAHPRA